MDRYTYKSSIEYRKYCIKELLKSKKLNLLKEVINKLNILKDLFKYKEDIDDYYNLNIKLTKYMPDFYSNVIYDYVNYGSTHRITNLRINNLKELLYYTNKTITAINKQINDLYYYLI